MLSQCSRNMCFGFATMMDLRITKERVSPKVK
ncbi:hypothetical protein AHF37_05525 [Paragonimus kellicotti]|nr:hypothetical protein AHF37_05525 [Paragonimus kellicotti]